MVPIFSAGAPLPPNFPLEFEPGLLIAAFLATLAVSVLLILLSVAAGGRSMQESNGSRVPLEPAPFPAIHAARRKGPSLAA
jgi:hypothetical protein